MKDETRDALLMGIAELVMSLAWANPKAEEVKQLISRAQHEQDRPTDRGA